MGTESTESALEQFREQWREEVSKKSKGKGKRRSGKDVQGNSGSDESAAVQKKVAPPPYLNSSRDAHDRGDHAPKGQGAYIDARVGEAPGENETSVKAAAQKPQVGAYEAHPKSALAHYEAAVERETSGNLGDSVKLYRQAYKLDDNVHEAYKKKHFPSASLPPTKASSPPASSTTATPQATSHAAHPTTGPATSTNISKSQLNTITDLITTFANLSIPAAEPPTSLSPPLSCPISTLPTEILNIILTHCATTDPQTLPHLALTCRALAYSTYDNPLLYRHVLFDTPHGIRAQHYRYACSLGGPPLDDPYISRPSCRIRDLTPGVYPTHRVQYRHRPRIRFGGVYISTVNYTRPGGHSLSVNSDGSTTGSTVSKHTWSAASPVHIVTYYRYLRFYRDGSCISLLSNAEPAEVIPLLSWQNMTLPSSAGGGENKPGMASKGGKDAVGREGGAAGGVMKEARIGRWRISGSASGPAPLSDVDPGEDGETRNDWSKHLSKRVGEYAKEPRLAPVRGGAVQKAIAIGRQGQEDEAPKTEKEGEHEEDDDDDDDDEDHEEEEEGTLHLETQGIVPRYLWKMQFRICSSRKDPATPPPPPPPPPPSSSSPTTSSAIAPPTTHAPNGPTRNNKLAWRGFWYYNKMTDDWGEFGLKNDRDRGFVWSRVRGWGVG